MKKATLISKVWTLLDLLAAPAMTQVPSAGSGWASQMPEEDFGPPLSLANQSGLGRLMGTGPCRWTVPPL